MHLPTKSGYYWILQDIGISKVRTVCHVWVKETGEVLVMSQWDAIPRASDSPDWNKNILFPKFKPWNLEYESWEGPLEAPEFFVDIKTGEKINWLKQ